MSYATDDAEMSSAREILAECRARVMVAFRQEEARDRPDAQRLADLQAVITHLRDETHAVLAGDRAVVARARLLYGLLLKASHSPALT
nr:hypothetical protein [Luteibacter rhizovicinus]